MLTLKLAKNYMWIFTSRIFRLALETTFFAEQVFFPAKGLRVTLTKS